MTELTPTPPFDPFKQAGNIASRWTRWKAQLEYYIDVRGVTVDSHKRALLLHLTGPDVQDIFATLQDTGTAYKDAITALDTYCSPQKNFQFERRTFRQTHQAPNEPINQYIMHLRCLGKNCEFDKYSLDEAIKDQLIEHCCFATLRRHLLREKSSASLSSLLEIACSMESANFQAAKIESTLSHDHSANARHITDSCQRGRRAGEFYL